MAKLARKGKADQRVRNVAVQLTTTGFLNGTGLQQKDYEGEARRLFAFVRDDIRYVRDTDGVEILHDPATLLQTGAGDCDDKSILLAALLGSLGAQTRFVAISTEPGAFCHVWVQVYLPPEAGGRWVDLEPTEPVPFGQSVPLAGALQIITEDV